MSAEDASLTALYRLVEDETQTRILAAHDIVGFFVDEAASNLPVRMIETSCQADSGAKRLQDVELQVIDLHGEVIGAYYVGEVPVVGVKPSRTGRGTDVELSFGGYSCPFRYAGELWRAWASGAPKKLGEWTLLPSDWHASWLHVVQKAWFSAGRRAGREERKSSYGVDGKNMASIAGFYCSLGEAVNGPGGYFGSNPSALDDCLRNSMVHGDRLELVWHNFDMSERVIDKAELGYVIDIFKDLGVQLITRTN